MKIIHHFVAAAALVLASGAPLLSAAEYPTRPVKIIVPLTAGGPGDVVTRAVAQRLSAAFGKPFYVENMGGANMNIGGDYVARAEPDGHTLMMMSTPMLISPALYPKMAYHPVRDFAPISMIASFPLILIANKSMPFKTVGELIAYAKQHPNELNYGSSGTGSSTHLAGELFASMSDIKLVHVPYRGINEAVMDLIGGQVQLSFAGAPIAIPNADQGKVVALASTSPLRSPRLPQIPTIAEGGLPGYDVTPWYGIVAPAKAPPEVIQRLHDEIVKIMRTDAIREQWASLGADPSSSASTEAFGKLMQKELEMWDRIVKDAKISVN